MGVFALGIEGYQTLVEEKCWWFKTTNIPRCKKRYLQKIHAWRQPKGMMDAEYLAQADKVLNQLNWRQFAHQEDWAPDLRGFAPASFVVDLDPTPGLVQPLLTKRAADFCELVEQELNLGDDTTEQRLARIASEADKPVVVATAKAGIGRVATEKSGRPLSPSKKQKVEPKKWAPKTDAPTPLYAATTAPTAAPAAAAVSVGPPRFKDVRGAKEEQMLVRRQRRRLWLRRNLGQPFRHALFRHASIARLGRMCNQSSPLRSNLGGRRMPLGGFLVTSTPMTVPSLAPTKGIPSITVSLSVNELTSGRAGSTTEGWSTPRRT